MLKARARAQVAKTARAAKGAPEPDGDPTPRNPLSAAAQAPGAPPPADMLFLRWDQIAGDPANPRQAFDDTELLALSDSIAAHGLLQNLVVGPAIQEEHVTGPQHPIIAGERRWRAIRALINGGQWPGDRLIPCRLMAGGDESAGAFAALIENLQRVDLNHMELGEGFETLGARFHLSNKAIAEQVGATAEYVQQHRRLIRLDADAQDALREGDLSMHDALQIVSKPKAAELGAANILLLGEILHKVNHDCRKGGYGGVTEIAHSVVDPHLAELQKRNFVNVQKRDWQAKRDWVSRGWALHEFRQGPLAAIEGQDAGASAELLFRLRAAVVGDEEAMEAAKAERYITPWLNGPFYLHPEAQAELDREKAVKAKAREASKAAKFERERALTRAKVLASAVADGLIDAGDSEIRLLFTDAGVLFPLKVSAGRVIDQKGHVVVSADWRFGDKAEAVALLVCATLNLAHSAAVEPEAQIVPTCRVCGCTETAACETAQGPCHWVEPDLCSAPACAGRRAPAVEFARQIREAATGPDVEAEQAA